MQANKINHQPKSVVFGWLISLPKSNIGILSFDLLVAASNYALNMQIIFIIYVLSADKPPNIEFITGTTTRKIILQYTDKNLIREQLNFENKYVQGFYIFKHQVENYTKIANSVNIQKSKTSEFNLPKIWRENR